MPKGFRTRPDTEEQVIALAQTSMTQDAIAEKTGISRRQVERIWEKAGISRRSEDTVRREVTHRLAAQGPPQPGKTDKEMKAQAQTDAEAMRRHWDSLLPVLRDLEGIGVLSPRGNDIQTWLSRPEEPSWPVTEGYVRRDDKGRLSVRLFAEGRLEWQYLKQHLVRDPVWEAIEDWKLAISEDMAARRKLFDALLREVKSGTNLKIIPGVEHNSSGEPGLGLYYVHTIYDQVISQVLGIRLALKGREEFIDEAEGKVRLGSYVIVIERDPKGRADAINFLLEAQTKFVEMPEAKAAGAAYHEVEAKTSEVRHHLRRILLAPGLPPGSVCDGCRAWFEERRD